MLSLIALLIVSGPLIIYSFTLDAKNGSANFEQSIWREHNDSLDVSPRAAMALDVIDNVVVQGMTQSELIGILGTPDEKVGDTSITYFLGASKPWMFAPLSLGFLVIHLDEQGRVLSGECVWD